MAFSVGTVMATIGANMKPFQKAMGKVRDMGMGMTQSLTAPILGVGALAVKTAADYEKLRVSMDTLNGSAEEGARNFERLKRFSAETPFQLQDLASAQNMLQGFGLAADESFQSIKMIGDIAAVTGGDIQGIGIAFGQAAAEGKLMSRDIRQLINQGVPAIKLLADTMGVAESEVFDLASQGEISFEILQQSFKQATSEGGIFANGMKRQANTLSGVFSTLKDNVSLAMGELGSSLSEAFNLTELVKQVTTGIKRIVSSFRQMSDEAKKRIFIITGLLASGGPLLLALSAIGPIVAGIGTAFAALVSPIGLVISAVAGLSAAILYIWDNWKAIKERISDISWWRNALINIAQFAIDYNPFTILINGFNALAKALGMSGIPNPYAMLSNSLEGLKADTKEYETEFGSFTRALNNGISSLTGIDIASIFTVDDGKNFAESLGDGIGYASIKSKEFALDLQNMKAQTMSVTSSTRSYVNAINLANNIADSFTNSFGQGLSNVIVQGERVIDVLENIGKLLLSSVIQKGISALLTGGLGGGGFFGSGGGLFGKIFGTASATAAAPVASNAMPMQMAFERALDNKMAELTPEAVWVMGEKGRLGV